MSADTMPLMAAIAGTGVTVVLVGIALGGMFLTLLTRQESRTNARIDNLETQIKELRAETRQQFADFHAETNQQFAAFRAETNQQFAAFRAETNQQFAAFRAEIGQQFSLMDERLRSLEKGQAYLAGEFSIIKDFFTHQSRPESSD